MRCMGCSCVLSMRFTGVERKVRLSHPEIFLAQFAPRWHLAFFPRVQSADHEARWRRTAQRANAAVRPAAPYTTDILREAWCVWLLSLRSFTWDWWRDRQNRAPVHRQKSARISKSRPHPTHVALATLVRQPTAYPPLHSAPSTLLGWQDIVGVITFRAVFALSWNVRRV